MTRKLTFLQLLQLVSKDILKKKISIMQLMFIDNFETILRNGHRTTRCKYITFYRDCRPHHANWAGRVMIAIVG